MDTGFIRNIFPPKCGVKFYTKINSNTRRVFEEELEKGTLTLRLPD